MAKNELQPEFETKINRARDILLDVKSNLSHAYSDSRTDDKIDNSPPHTLIGLALQSFETAPNIEHYNRKEGFEIAVEALGSAHQVLGDDGQTTAANKVAEAMVLIIQATSVQCPTFSVGHTEQNLPDRYRKQI